MVNLLVLLWRSLKELARMAKLSRQKLKNVVKECLVEILQEGLTTQGAPNPAVNLNESNSRQISRMQAAQTRNLSAPNGHAPMPNRSRAADNISYGPRGDTSTAANPQFDQKVNNTISHLTDDPVMAAIFSDSARTTLQEQLQAENRTPAMTQGDQAARAMASSDPTDLFAGASQNWAQLAFSD